MAVRGVAWGLGVALMLLGACRPTVIILPGPVGTAPQPPELGENLGDGSPALCGALRDQLRAATGEMQGSLEEIRRFQETYAGDVDRVQEFDRAWRATFIAQKRRVFGMKTCDGFVAEWALVLSIWRDIFRHEKEVGSALRNAESTEVYERSARKIGRALTQLREALGS